MNLLDEAHAVAERTARESYGKLIAIIGSHSGDLAAAEDALSGALSKALALWPERGIPDSPEAWLVTVSKRMLIDVRRREELAATIEGVREDSEAVVDQTLERLIQNGVFPDERLKLMFVCAHPAIDEAIRAPLMLQTVLGLEADTIARAMLIKPATMGQRLVRAKKKIKLASIPFALPDPDQLQKRLPAVQEAIYAMHAANWLSSGTQDLPTSLSNDALFLSLLLQRTFGDAESQALSALIMYSEARHRARYTDDGSLIALQAQDTAYWDHAAMGQADALLASASTKNELGRFQLEAAIESAHCERRRTQQTPWNTIAQLYTGLCQLAPSQGAWVARATAIGHAESAVAGLQALEVAPVAESFQPIWAAKAYLLEQAGKTDEALAAYQRAIELSSRSTVRQFLERKMRELRCHNN